MILINAQSPRWCRELDRFIHLKSLLLVHGNILDLVSYQIQPEQPDQLENPPAAYWIESNLASFFQRLLSGYGYDLIGLFDPIEGLTFYQQEPMQQLYQAILKEAQGTTPSPIPRPPRAGMPAAEEWVDPLPLVKNINIVLANRQYASAFIFNFASRLSTAPDRLTKQEQALFTHLLKGSLNSREVIKGSQRWNNVLILLCDKVNDLPAFLYLDNPRSRTLFIDKPGIAERTRFIHTHYASFYSSQPLAVIPKDVPALFSALTEGFSYYEMLSLVGLSIREKIPLEQLPMLIEHFKYGVTESDWDKLDKDRLERAGEIIRNRIKGQETAVLRLLEIIKRAKLGLAAGTAHKTQRPRGVLFFAGPTGVGKTEMAKGLAQLLFGQEDRLIRFDMSEYAAPHADQKLLGSPPGYVGYEEGGKLTNAMKQQPFSVLLFDEIEKAHPSIFDKFLQILDDGRLTDGKGETVYFAECILIFTSNLGTYSPANATSDPLGNPKTALVSTEQPYSEVKDIMLAAIQYHFNHVLGRPEILNRFGENFVVFDFIRPPVAQEILAHLLQQLIQTLHQQHHILLHIEAAVRTPLLHLAYNYLNHGGRGIRNMLEAYLINPLASLLFDRNIPPGTVLRLTHFNAAEIHPERRLTLVIEQHEPLHNR